MSHQIGPFGFHTEPRLNLIPQDDWEFIWSAVDAGWTTPRIMQELDLPASVVFALARVARQEARERLRVCEHCRRNIATGKRDAAAKPEGDAA